MFVHTKYGEFMTKPGFDSIVFMRGYCRILYMSRENRDIIEVMEIPFEDLYSITGDGVLFGPEELQIGLNCDHISTNQKVIFMRGFFRAYVYDELGTTHMIEDRISKITSISLFEL